MEVLLNNMANSDANVSVLYTFQYFPWNPGKVLPAQVTNKATANTGYGNLILS